MTDIAAIFHWSLADMEAMDLPELADWRERAVAWHNRVHGAKKSG
ncbi:MAG: GpE family phage tail protein [Sphingomonadaceae bacterium]|nr:GpE family phage tail protein [Sphingomonadaceae bacterium]